ncbi:hypothetical protein HanOQP8_Chr05g0180061 [Helianthus annuus]|nr:hypothetical protein HanOQP8_Chr05g0180061 [Helianthus annuus]
MMGSFFISYFMFLWSLFGSSLLLLVFGCFFILVFGPGHSMRDCGSTVIKNFGASIKFLRWKLGEKVNFLDGYVLLFGWVYICCPSLLTGSEFVGWAGSVPGFVIGSGFALRSGSSPGLHSELLVLSSEFFFRVCSWFIYPSLEGLCVWIWCAAQFV